MSSKSAATSESLLDELQATLAHGTVARRVETLRRVTDLFINGAVDFSDKQIGLFDDVFQCLIDHIETSAKALLANRLAPIDTAPPLTIRALAFDDLIEVAAPVLSRSERLDDEALIETARNKSQAHLMAISTRRVLSGAVTDVLVLRGNDEVIQSTVNNPGAEFSERGFTRLRPGVDRREHDDRNPRRGRHDPGKGRGIVLVDGQGNHQLARRSLGHGAGRPCGLQGHLRAAAALDRTAGAALPPHAAGCSANGVSLDAGRE
jgi:Uncharacterised protein conserved in bacteria (DUF2336)